MAALNIPNLEYKKIEEEFNKRNASANNPEMYWNVVGVDDFLYDFVYKIAVANPMWRFEATSVTRVHHNDAGGGGFNLNGFDVYEKRELLGHISKERNYTRREDVYCLRNKRISNERERGNTLKTGNRAKALSAVKKYFSLPKPIEIVEDRIEKATRALQSLMNAKSSPINYMWLDRQPEVQDFILKRWDEFLTTLPNPKEYEPNIPQAIAEQNMVSKMRYAAVHSEMYEVVAVDSTYYIRFKDDLTIVDSTALPEKLRSKLGMLKLVEVGQAVEGVGFKAADDTFLITGESDDMQG